MKKNIISVFEITESHFKFIRAKNLNRKAIISECQATKINNYTDEELIRFLKDISTTCNLQKDLVVGVIPRRLIITKKMHLPSLNIEELKKMVPLQLVNQIPYSVDDVIFDFYVLEKEKSGYTFVNVVIVHRDIVERYINIFQKANVHIDRLIFSSFGLLGWVNYEETKKLIDIKKPFAIINIDLNDIDICLCHNKILMFSRSLKYGAKDLNLESVDSLINQIELTIDAFKKENNVLTIEKVIVLSTLPEATIVKEAIEKDLHLSTELFNSLENIYCQKNINIANLGGQKGISLAAGLGFIVSDESQKINLLPKEVHETKKSLILRQKVIKIIYLFVLVFLLTIGLLSIEISTKKKQLEDIKQRSNMIESEFRDVKKKSDIVNFLKDKALQTVFVPDVIQEVHKITPPGISYREIAIDASGIFSLVGYSQTNSSINDLQASMVNSRLFKEVNLQYSTKRKTFNFEVLDFKITGNLKKQE